MRIKYIRQYITHLVAHYYRSFPQRPHGTTVLENSPWWQQEDRGLGASHFSVCLFLCPVSYSFPYFCVPFHIKVYSWGVLIFSYFITALPGLFEVPLGKLELLLVLLNWEVGLELSQTSLLPWVRIYNCRSMYIFTGATRQVVEARGGMRGSEQVGGYVNRSKQIQRGAQKKHKYVF